MCIVCKKREKQSSLNRFQCIENELSKFTGKGRSFYVCSECINSRKFINYISKKCNINKEQAKIKIEKIN